MPLFRVNGQLHFFAHVPKCAGTSVEHYLRERFGGLAFYDNFHTQTPPHRQWSNTSPQHIDTASFYKLIPENWIASSFAVVRHPVKRVISAYHFQAEVEGKLDGDHSIDDWLASWIATADNNGFMYDNHLRRQTELVPDDAQIFYLEHGLDGVVGYLDALAGNSNGPRSILGDNIRKTGDKPALTLSDASLALIADYYAADFARFGYTLKNPKPLAAKPTTANAPPPGPAEVFVRRLKRKIARKLGTY
jgi:Sulfotransferase family